MHNVNIFFFHFISTVVDYVKYVPGISAADSQSVKCPVSLSYICSDYRQISVISVDGENARCRPVKRHGCNQRKHTDMQEKKPQEMEKLIQAETTETGRVSL